MLSIHNLHVRVGETPILKGLSLEIPSGIVCAIMGQNGSGKSTLGHVLAGRPGYEITAGTVEFRGRDLLSLSVEERSLAGLFLGMQYPVEVPGVTNLYFLRAMVNQHRQHQGIEEMDAASFLKWARERMKALNMDPEFLKRGLNTGFSGGEKKRNEILQMLMLEPALSILDEIDSGLDVDALQWVGRGVNALRHPDRSIVLITHYQRLLSEIAPDVVHVMADGKVIESGGKEIALRIEREGYGSVTS
jgi:Fe-S cluster assembly ATP-binding protein